MCVCVCVFWPATPTQVTGQGVTISRRHPISVRLGVLGSNPSPTPFTGCENKKRGELYINHPEPLGGRKAIVRRSKINKGSTRYSTVHSKNCPERFLCDCIKLQRNSHLSIATGSLRRFCYQMPHLLKEALLRRVLQQYVNDSSCRTLPLFPQQTFFFF